MNEFQFGAQTVKTKVNMMTAPEQEQIDIDITEYMPLGEMEHVDEAMFEKRSGAPDAAEMAVWEG